MISWLNLNFHKPIKHYQTLNVVLTINRHNIPYDQSKVIVNVSNIINKTNFNDPTFFQMFESGWEKKIQIQ